MFFLKRNMMDIHLIEEIENFSIREELSKYIYLDNRSDAQYISYYQQEIYPKLSWLNKKRAMKPERMILIHQNLSRKSRALGRE